MFFRQMNFLKPKDQKGAAAVEFALLLPALTLILVGIIIFGLIFNYYLEITHAAREGARWAALRQPFTEVQAQAQGAAPGIDPDKTTITMSANVPATGATDEDQDEPVTVTVRYDIAEVRAMFGVFGDFLPVAISSSATQKVE